ncbi:MAG: DNA polymerase III subunit delta [Pseudomonadota bacterium]
MKIPGYKVDGFIARPDKACRVALIYGPDHGLMKERADALARLFVADLKDPFNVAILESARWRGDAGLLEAEAQAGSLMGGQRVVRVQAADDALVPALQSYLQNPNPDAFVILEADELSPRSKLRVWAEKDGQAAALPCYTDDAEAISALARQILGEAGWQPAKETMQFLAQTLAGDRLRVRSELAKLALYMGKSDGRGVITLDDARAAIADVVDQALDDFVFALASRKPGAAMAALSRLLAEGEDPVGLIRMTANHFRRLHRVKCAAATGESVEAAMESLNPKVFYKQEDAFKTQIRNWTLPALEGVLSRLLSLEGQMKTTTPARNAQFGQAMLQLIA